MHARQEYKISLDGLSGWPKGGRRRSPPHDSAPDMARIKRCVVCDRPLSMSRKHVDTCNDRCFRQLLRKQRGLPSRAHSR